MFKRIFLGIFILFESIVGFHIFDESGNGEYLKDFTINPIESIDEIKSEFPQIFIAQFSNDIGEKQLHRFVKKSNVRLSEPKVYVMNNADKIVLYNPKQNNNFEHYEEIGGNGFATLVKDTENKLRFIGRLYSNTETKSFSDILPVVSKKSKNSYGHVMHKRNLLVGLLDLVDSLLDIVIDNTGDHIYRNITFSDSNSRNKRQVDLIEMEAETLVVTESSVFNYYSRILNTIDQGIIFHYMKVYFSHFMHAVNQKFENSFQNDPNLRVKIKFGTFLFLTQPTVFSTQKLGTLNGRDGVDGAKSLRQFSIYMENLTSHNPSLKFDHAIAIFNKDLWLGSSSGSSLAGMANFAQICQKGLKYSIAEDFGGFSGVFTVAHEMAHNLGAPHDGIRPAADCSSNSQFLMSSVSRFTASTIENSHKFSNCSIREMKKYLLYSREANTTCLKNQDISDLKMEEKIDIDSLIPGQAFTVDDQCKLRNGPQSSFCQLGKSTICSNLFCRISNNQRTCASYSPAANGTTCALGKVCINGVCLTNSLAPMNECPFGDGLVQRNSNPVVLPTEFVTCSEFFKLAIQQGFSPLGFCMSKSDPDVCCESCRKYKLLTCSDNDIRCPTLSCSMHANKCQRKCKICSDKRLECVNENSYCMNGGKCENYPVDVNFGFRCICPRGYGGDLCELRKPCESSPCKNGGTCIQLGTNGFSCRCRPGCKGDNCSLC